MTAVSEANPHLYAALAPELWHGFTRLSYDHEAADLVGRRVLVVEGEALLADPLVLGRGAPFGRLPMDARIVPSWDSLMPPQAFAPLLDQDRGSALAAAGRVWLGRPVAGVPRLKAELRLPVRGHDDLWVRVRDGHALPLRITFAASAQTLVADRGRMIWRRQEHPFLYVLMVWLEFPTRQPELTALTLEARARVPLDSPER